MAFWGPLKGVLTHSTPDWYADKLAWTVGNCTNGIGASGVLLWNDSSPAVNFYVYRFLISDPNYPGEIIGYFQQSIIGSLYNHAYPVVLNTGTPPGKVYNFTGNIPADQQHVPFDFSFNATSTLDVPSDSPLFVIPPNSGFVFQDTGTATGFHVNFWYVWR
jgi:hypothetical protein